VVFEAANPDEAARGLERQPVDLVTVALNLPHQGSSVLLAAMRDRPEWAKIPVLALANTARQAKSRAVRTAGFEDCQMKSDQAQVLESVVRLTSLLLDDEAIAVCAGEEK